MAVLIFPTLFFLPKFFELRTETKVLSSQTDYNCSLDVLEASNNDRMYSTTTLGSVPEDTVYPNISTTESSGNSSEIQNPCQEILRLINSTSSKDVLKEYESNELNGSSSKKNESIFLFDGRLKISYHIDNFIAYIFIIETMNTTFLDHTDLRRNRLYYKIYILGLTTVITQIVPMGILIFFNIKIYAALKASRFTRKTFLGTEKWKAAR